MEHARKRTDAQFELIDLKEVNLPLFDEPVPPMMAQYTQPHTLAWSKTIASFDGYVFVTPEYNHSTSAVLKNAIDYLYREWNNKAAGFVGYGGAGGARAIEHLRLIMAEVMVATVRHAVTLSMQHDFEHYTIFKPGSHHEGQLKILFDQVIAWSDALKPLRAAHAH